MARALRVARAGLLLLLAAGCAAAGCAQPAEPPRHLVLITIDTLRADRLGAYGHDRPTSPHLDALAARGVRFDDAIAHSISTPPSHASILTGLLPPAHGLRKLWGQSLAPENTTLAERLSARGFVTAAFVSGLPLMRAAGLAQGFDVYDDAFAGEAREQRDARATNARVRAWLATRPPGPVFLWVHYFEPHAPYLAPADQQRRFVATPAPGAEALPAPRREGAPPPAERVAWMRALYDAEVATADAAVGELLALLDAAEILPQAIVAAVADHGECLGEGGRYFGHWGVGDEVARVPLLLARPDGRWAGTAVTATVRSVDLAPTLLAWLGLEVPEALAGRDLTPLLDGRERAPRPAYTEQMEVQPVQAVVRGAWRLRRPARPGARRGASLEARGGSPATDGARAARELLAVLEQALAGPATPALERPVAPDVAERLRALGYGE